MKNEALKIIYGFLMGFILATFTSIIIDKRKQEQFENYEVLYEVKIENEFINVRKGSTLGSDKIYEVLKGEKYEVIDTYNDSKEYNWYKIKFSTRRTGWIASPKNEEAWVTIIEK